MFIINSKRKKEATYLLSVKQGEKESLRQYVDRFRNATLEVRELQPGVAVAAMLQGTRSIPLQESLSLDQPKTLADLFVMANKYVTHAKMMKIVTSNDEKERKRKEREAQEEPTRKRDRGNDFRGSSKPRFEKFTPLNESRTSILASIQSSGLIRFPQKN